VTHMRRMSITCSTCPKYHPRMQHMSHLCKRAAAQQSTNGGCIIKTEEEGGAGGGRLERGEGEEGERLAHAHVHQRAQAPTRAWGERVTCDV